MASWFSIFQFSPLYIPLVYAQGITRVQGNCRNTTQSGTSMTVTMTSTPTSGNTLIAGIVDCSSNYVSSITETGVTWDASPVVASPVGGTAAQIWRGVVGAGASTTVTFNFNAAMSDVIVADVCEYSGLLTASPVDQTAYTNGASTTGDTGTTATTTQASELFVGAILAYASGGLVVTQTQNTYTLLDGIDVIISSTYHRSGAYLENIASSTGAAHGKSTIAHSATWYGCIATFKAAATGAQYSYSPNATVTVSSISKIAEEKLFSKSETPQILGFLSPYIIDRPYSLFGSVTVSSIVSSNIERGFVNNQGLTLSGLATLGKALGFSNIGTATLSGLPTIGIERAFSGSGIVQALSTVRSSLEKTFSISGIIQGLSNIGSGIESFFGGFGSIQISGLSVFGNERFFSSGNVIQLSSLNGYGLERGFLGSGAVQLATALGKATENAFQFSNALHISGLSYLGIEKSYSTPVILQILGGNSYGLEKGFATSSIIQLSSLLGSSLERMFNPSGLIQLSATSGFGKENLFTQLGTFGLSSLLGQGKELAHFPTGKATLFESLLSNFQIAGVIHNFYFYPSELITLASNGISNIEKSFTSTNIISLFTLPTFNMEKFYGSSETMILNSNGQYFGAERNFQIRGLTGILSTSSVNMEFGFSFSEVISLIQGLGAWGTSSLFPPTTVLGVPAYLYSGTLPYIVTPSFILTTGWIPTPYDVTWSDMVYNSIPVSMNVQITNRQAYSETVTLAYFAIEGQPYNVTSAPLNAKNVTLEINGFSTQSVNVTFNVASLDKLTFGRTYTMHVLATYPDGSTTDFTQIHSVSYILWYTQLVAITLIILIVSLFIFYNRKISKAIDNATKDKSPRAKPQNRPENEKPSRPENKSPSRPTAQRRERGR